MIRTPTRPAESAVAVTASNTTVFAPTRGVYVAGAGNLAVTFADGSEVTLTNIAAGVVHPLSVVQVKSTGTTATGIVALR